jgi:hypothetical protein
MTKDEFIDYYCRNSQWVREQFEKHRVALPCYCGDDSCQGWASVTNDPDLIEEHMRHDGMPREITNDG